MRKFVGIVFFGLALAVYGVGMSTTAFADETSTQSKPLIRCDTCGTTFTSQAGVEDHLRAHPEHKISTQTGPEAAKPLIKCDTCGTTFTSQAGLEDHLKTHPGHKAATTATSTTPIPPSHPLIKCSTCGVEFTSRAEAEEHIKAHPEHILAPEQQ